MKTNLRKINFARYLFEGSTQQEAARRAGYKGSTGVLQSRGSKLAADAEVQAEIERLRKEAENHAIMSRDEILQRLTRIARFDVKKILADNGGIDRERLLNSGVTDILQEYTPELAEAIPGVPQIEAQSVFLKIKLPGRLDALTTIAKLQGYFAAEKHEMAKAKDPSDMTLQEIEEQMRRALEKGEAGHG